MSIVTTIETLAAICRHELRLEEVYDITRLIREVKIVQETSNDSYAKLTKKQKINAREILSGYMLAWEYVEDLDGSGIGQRFWKGEISRPNTLSWPKNKKEWCAITEFQLRLLIYVRILAGVEKMFLELQDYSEIDRQEKNSRSKPVTYREEVSQTSMSGNPPSNKKGLDFRMLDMPHHHKLDRLGSCLPSNREDRMTSNPKLIPPVYLTTLLLSPEKESSANDPPARGRTQKKLPAMCPATEISIRDEKHPSPISLPQSQHSKGRER